MSTDFDGINDIVKELDREESKIVIRLEMRKFRKPTTVVDGMPGSTIPEVTKKLKHALATGGTGKNGQIILQGDQRENAKQQLVREGYSESSIEVQ
jgi:translation initiation factor 1